MKKLKVLSLFDGMSCGRIALEKAGIPVSEYYASEIDKYAIQVSKDNWDDITHLGDVTRWREWDIDWSNIDLVIGGFPCQAWSIAGRQLGDKDPRGKLFWDMLDIMKKVLSVNTSASFLIENVKMKKEFEQYITFHTEKALGKVYKKLINSSLVSAQNRQRYFWTNIPYILQPEDKKLYLKDIIENGTPINYSSSGRGNGRIEGRFTETSKAHTLTATGYSKRSLTEIYQVNPSIEAGGKQPYMQNRVFSIMGKSHSLTAAFASRTNIEINGLSWRKLSVLECKRLQTVPDDYIMNVSDSQAYKMLGNGWTVDVIAHIFKNIGKLPEQDL